MAQANEPRFSGLGEVKKLNNDGSLVLASTSSEEREILVTRELQDILEIDRNELREGDTLYYESEPLRNAGKNSCHEIALRVAETVVASGVVSKLQSGHAVLKTEQYGDVFFAGSAVKDVYPISSYDLTKLFRAGDEMHFVAWDQYFTDSKITTPASRSSYKARYKAESVWFPVMKGDEDEKYGVVVRILSQEAAIAYNKPTGKILILKDLAYGTSDARLAFGDRIKFKLDSFSAMTARKMMGCRFQAASWTRAPNLIFKREVENRGGFGKVSSSEPPSKPSKKNSQKAAPRLPVGMTISQQEVDIETKPPLRNATLALDDYSCSQQAPQPTQIITFTDPFDNEDAQPPQQLNFAPPNPTSTWSNAVKHGPLPNSSTGRKLTDYDERKLSPPDPNYAKFAKEMDNEWDEIDDDLPNPVGTTTTQQFQIPGLSPPPLSEKEDSKSASSSVIAADREISQINRETSVPRNLPVWVQQPSIPFQPNFSPLLAAAAQQISTVNFTQAQSPFPSTSPAYLGGVERGGSAASRSSAATQKSELTQFLVDQKPLDFHTGTSVATGQTIVPFPTSDRQVIENGSMENESWLQDASTQTEEPLLEVQIVNKIVGCKELMTLICEKHPDMIQALLMRH